MAIALEFCKLKDKYQLQRDKKGRELMQDQDPKALFKQSLQELKEAVAELKQSWKELNQRLDELHQEILGRWW